MTTRADIVAAARARLGIRYHRRGRSHTGLDCAGLLIVVARELGIVPADFDVPEYMNPDGTMIAICDHHLLRISRDAMQPGDAVSIATQEDPQHMGIIGPYRHGGLSIIHASDDRLHHGVIEHRLMFSPRFRFAAAWSFPGV